MSDCTIIAPLGGPWFEFLGGMLLNPREVTEILRAIPNVENIRATRDFRGNDSVEADYYCSDGYRACVDLLEGYGSITVDGSGDHALAFAIEFAARYLPMKGVPLQVFNTRYDFHQILSAGIDLAALNRRIEEDPLAGASAFEPMKLFDPRWSQARTLTLRKRNSPLHDRLRRDALQIWHAGLSSVDSTRLVRRAVEREGTCLWVCDKPLELAPVRRIAIVGAGKAGAGMAAGLLETLGPEILAEKHVTGWINVPEDCVRSLPPLTLHPARPAGLNEPNEAGVRGAQEILRLVRSLESDDLCFCLISGGASALLPAPAEGISLADKLAVTRQLSAAGANIAELNVVRKQISQIKGGGLARACHAGQLITLIISDVLGDPLPVIASGPTVEDISTPEEALAVLERFDSRRMGVPEVIFDYLQRRQRVRTQPPECRVTNQIIGNLVIAIDAAGMEAERLGYSHAMTCARQLEGEAEDIGRHLAEMAVSMRRGPGPDCLISGGEPVVRLAPPKIRGRGGRNQQLALAALEVLAGDGGRNIALLSGGTDGEDGPTDAAGAVVDEQVIAAARQLGLDSADYLKRSDAYHFFEPLGGLIKTGPTHTNVGDLRVVVVSRG